MKNKTLSVWLWATLASALFLYSADNSNLCGFVILANWVFVIIAAVRLHKMADK